MIILFGFFNWSKLLIGLQEEAGVAQLKTTSQLVSLIKTSGLVNLQPAEDVDVDADTKDELRSELGIGKEADFKVVQVHCQLADFAVGSSR
jgi:hypothetical protein